MEDKRRNSKELQTVYNSVLNIVLGFYKQETCVRVGGFRKVIMKDAELGLGLEKQVQM